MSFFKKQPNTWTARPIPRSPRVPLESFAPRRKEEDFAKRQAALRDSRRPRGARGDRKAAAAAAR